MTADRVRSKTLASWIFGSLLLLFVLGVFAFAPERLPEYKQKILALVMAILAGLFGYFLTGSIGIKLTALRTKLGDVNVDAAGGLALFVLVMVWWLSPLAPVGTGGVAVVRITVLGSDKMPIEDAQVWSSVGGEAKRVAGGWELEFPLSKLPQDRKITVYAAQRAAHLNGQQEISVNEDEQISASIQLKRETSAQVKGNVYDDSGKPIERANVSILGSGNATTDAQGFFSIPTNAAAGEDVRLHVSRPGYETIDQYHPAGADPAYVVLKREKR
jgi:hypothetical protein